MEFAVCLAGGFSLIVVGVCLFRIQPPDWQKDGDLTDTHRKAIVRWASVQRWVRLANNSLLMLIGGVIIASAFIPHGRAWMLVWGAILVLLLICIMLAMLDAFSSLAGYRRALPEAARRSFSPEKELPPLES